ncbi:uncharacterized protein MONBRDRAFT_22535 [Monosiga brevicollis MX1]|uniref:Uncharacterized protein n=1 Tax=Monosiga brevicollis TaxID=81824 RepID=A9UQV5_MONBE|nr:uncharacterized protein MONBRDRAFT_22535 [Monosiga brevicollis MX1]EDQ92664.1 predicted protein [Monosiga brevicollis MX1]|eukprot:XP_001742426.1 hypothetical protein [Monosiga brevicollis MX1]
MAMRMAAAAAAAGTLTRRATVARRALGSSWFSRLAQQAKVSVALSQRACLSLSTEQEAKLESLAERAEHFVTTSCALNYPLSPPRPTTQTRSPLGNQFDEAIMAYNEAMAIERRSDLVYNAAVVNLMKRNLQDAKALLIESIERNPSSAEAHNNLGCLYAELGQADKARTHLKKALQLMPQDASTAMNLALICDKLGHLEDARHYYKSAIALDPRMPREPLRNIEAKLLAQRSAASLLSSWW